MINKGRRRRSITAAMPERSRRAGEMSTLMPAGLSNINDHLPEDLLELVLLHAHSFDCVVRAAATCKLWRRVFAGDAAAFLRRFGGLHPPHVLGHFYCYDGRRRRPLFVPSPTPPGEAAVDIRGRVSLDFIDNHQYHSGMQLSDGGCSSLLAFVKYSSTVVVCDSWTREHRELPRWSPWKLSKRGRWYSGNTIGAFLLAAGEDDTGASMSCFRLLCVSLVREFHAAIGFTKTAWATMYSARDDRWISLGSREVSTIMPSSLWQFDARNRFLGRAGASLCWSGDVSNAVLHLDESSGAFSTFTLPLDVGHDQLFSYHRGNLRVIGGGSGSVLLARILNDDLEVLRWSRNNGGGECKVERKVCLSRLTGIESIKLEWSWRFLDTAETVTPGHVVLLPDEKYMWMFSVNVDTMVLMRSEKRNWHAHRVFPYHLPWPTIKVYV